MEPTTNAPPRGRKESLMISSDLVRSHLSTPVEARLIACSVLRTRFAGRAEMTKAVEFGSRCAGGSMPFSVACATLLDLEARLGILPAPIDVFRDVVAADRAAPGHKAEAARRRDERKSLRSAPVPETALVRHARDTVSRDARRYLRHTTHGAELTVAVGTPTATSKVSKTYPSSVGLPNSYDWRVTCSSMRLVIDPMGALVMRAENEPGTVYLSRTVRVRQSRGTAVRVERLTGSRWA